ncbi:MULTISPECIES: hypothetical protein [unclassified Acinetobacter]|uniref:hypothetical protein n=2 Tax=unclassified Acinetobacter TaxID=196816 RepID=UPI00287C0BF5|nr:MULTISPECIES: hypothetical protein [unclassified Acinetobacter]MDS7932862.1 hypothetical protein [Acinetobacter sp. V91_4B]
MGGGVEVYDANSKKWISKAGNDEKSTFFPSGWTKEQMQFELITVYQQGVKSGKVGTLNAFEAISPSGVIKFVPPPKGHTTITQWRAWPVK